MQAPFFSFPMIFVTWTFSGIDNLEKPASLYVIWKDTSDGNTNLAWREKG